MMLAGGPGPIAYVLRSVSDIHLDKLYLLEVPGTGYVPASPPAMLMICSHSLIDFRQIFSNLFISILLCQHSGNSKSNVSAGAIIWSASLQELLMPNGINGRAASARAWREPSPTRPSLGRPAVLISMDPTYNTFCPTMTVQELWVYLVISYHSLAPSWIISLPTIL